MKRIIIISLIIITSFIKVTLAQVGDHLEPLKPFFGINFQYYTNLGDILQEDISPYQVIQFITFPSFGSESLLAIGVDSTDLAKDSRKFYIYYNTSKSNIWHSKDIENIEIIKYKKLIDDKYVDIIKELYDIALEQTKYSGRIGIDGATFYFATLTKAGKTWSPREGTKLRELINISQELTKLVKGKGKKIRLNQDFVEKIENLIERFKTAKENDS